MSPLNLLGYGFVLPAVLSLLLFLALGWTFRRLNVKRADRAAGSLAIGLAYIAAQCALAMPEFPPIDVTDRIPWIVGLAMLLELAEALSPAPLWARLENRMIVIAIATGAIVGPILGATIETRSGAVWVVGVGIVAFLSQWNMDAQSERTAIVPTAFSRIAILLAAGVSLLASGSLILGELGLSLAAAFGAVALLDLKTRRTAGGPVVIAAVTALLLDGYIYASLPSKVALVLVVAPLAGWLGAIPALKRGSGWRGSVVVSTTLFVLAIAVYFAATSSPSYE